MTTGQVADPGTGSGTGWGGTPDRWGRSLSQELKRSPVAGREPRRARRDSLAASRERGGSAHLGHVAAAPRCSPRPSLGPVRQPRQHAIARPIPAGTADQRREGPAHAAMAAPPTRAPRRWPGEARWLRRRQRSKGDCWALFILNISGQGGVMVTTPSTTDNSAARHMHRGRRPRRPAPPAKP